MPDNDGTIAGSELEIAGVAEAGAIDAIALDAPTLVVRCDDWT